MDQDLRRGLLGAAFSRSQSIIFFTRRHGAAKRLEMSCIAFKLRDSASPREGSVPCVGENVECIEQKPEPDVIRAIRPIGAIRSGDIPQSYGEGRL